jgi:hypothetical protein
MRSLIRRPKTPKCGKLVKLFAPITKVLSMIPYRFHHKNFGRFSI